MFTTEDTIEGAGAQLGPEGTPSAELRRRRLAAKMFGVVEDEPVRFGRFVLMGHLGAGGVGTVHLAYDPQLDRRVALKLLRFQRASSDISRKRMLREAKLLAKLSDPNIVHVYEAGILDNQVFIVMEFVTGKTLRDWVFETEPDWRTVLEIYIQAGRGLAAAHGIGLVHRDFKPDNAIRGDDGRVRVLDFGLAKVRSSHEEVATISDDDGASVAPAESSGPLVTDVGAIMGTPAYMAPEQFGGADVGPEADQFSFCVALYEALYRVRPFVNRGNRQAPTGTPTEPSETDVPRWVFTAVRRGLALGPDARHPSMRALLDELEQGLGRRQRRVQRLVGGLGLMLVFGLTVALSLRGTDEPHAEIETCTGGTEQIEGVWSEQTRETLGATLLGTGQVYAQELWPRVEQGLDAYASEWAAMHREACEVHQRGEQSDSLFDQRMVCLDRRFAGLASAIEVLGGTRPEGLVKALEVVDGLPELASCADVEALGRVTPPPDSPELAARVASAREELLLAETYEHAGRYDEARLVSERVVDQARAADYPPLVAEALLVHGRVRLGLDEHGPAAELLREASLTGFELGLDPLALEALARQLYAQAMQLGKAPEALASVPLAQALTQRFPEATFARALLLNNAGTAHLAAGQRDEARALFEQALALVERTGVVESELNGILINLALVEPSAGRRRELTGRAADQLEAALGPSHPQTLVANYVYSHNLTDPEAAMRVRADVCERYARDHVHEQVLTRECWYTLAFVHADLGDEKAALEAFERAGAIESSEPGGEVMNAVARAYAALLGGRAGVAVERFEAVLAAATGAGDEQWWVSRHFARALIGLADARRALGESELERVALEQALERLEQIATMTDDADLERAMIRVEARLGP